MKITTSPFSWRPKAGTPEKIVRGLVVTRLLESEHERSLRIHSAEHVSNDAVFAGGVKCLEYYEKRLAAIRIKQVLQLVHALDMFADLGCSLFRGTRVPLRKKGRFSTGEPSHLACS